MTGERGDASPAFIRRPPRGRLTRRGEFDFIARIRRQALNRTERAGARAASDALIPHPSAGTLPPSSLVTGIGDDAAVMRGGRGLDTVVTADLLVEGVDFRLSTTTPRLLGHKALAVSLSDVAAMGARPRWALVSLGVPRALWDGPFLEEFYAGFFALADAHGVTLVGGDVSRTAAHGAHASAPAGESSSDGPLVIDSIVLGEVGRGRAVTRAGARPGDRIYVTGALGGAAAGLRLLEADARAGGTKNAGETKETAATEASAAASPRGAGRVAARPPAVSAKTARGRVLLRQLRPEPRVEWGLLLGESRLASAMIDLSDGLSSDLAHLCAESGAGARLDAARLPADADAARALRLRPDEALRLALSGGEDFELLFTVRPRNVSKLPAHVGGVPATLVGVVTGDAGRLTLSEDGRERALAPEGFRHF